ncbi:hypothetical protein ACHAW5_000761 [Stephanodiscus triporus]|uniref:Uncharacterized protein n=1 Tax=Stephanodiscus triporus TaxID=2934178 RepID=A0ABD3PPI4_9STRA
MANGCCLANGTSYTIHTIRRLTNTTTASNYGLEGTIKDEESVPVFKGDGGMNGPYLELIRGVTTNIPKLILTKTHCGGYTVTHNPNSYIVTPCKFLKDAVLAEGGSVRRTLWRAKRFGTVRIL